MRVNCVAPGFVKTQMMSETNLSFDDGRDAYRILLHPLGLGDPEDVKSNSLFTVRRLQMDDRGNCECRWLVYRPVKN